MWIEELTIENYRGIAQMKLSPKPVNIFVGRNNTGKSSVLEAVVIAATSPTGYADSLNQDLLRAVLRRSRALSYYIRVGNEKATIRIDTEAAKPLEVELLYVEKGLPEDYSTVCKNLIDKWAARTFYRREERKENTKKIMDSPKLVIVAGNREAFPKSVENVIIINKTIGLIRDGRILPSSLFYVGAGHGPEIVDLYNRALQSGLLPALLQTIHLEIPYLYDLRTVEDELFVFVEGLDKPLPVSVMGDGFIALLRTAFATFLAKDGTLVLEEPEANLHPGFVEISTSHLVESARKHRTQLFISTHSTEFLDSMLEKGPDIMQVVRMYLVKGEIDYEVLSGEEALMERKELLMDLRGA
ncbi:MAG: AAA family ATPase [Candidatus Caldarchaeum sp.]|nr:AAA family ATPase [Candidatus Caldarchaeum sp.]